jgi:bifunctional hydroxylase/dehydrase
MDTDVIIVGAGPTGLMLAGELRLGGASVVVLERLTAPTAESRGLGFNARAMETFDQRGLMPRFGEVETSPMGHFGGNQFDFRVLPDAHFGARGIPQYRIEAMLTEWVLELGADIRRGWEVIDLADLGDEVEVTAHTEQGERQLRASYLVGCDGGHSAVRSLAEFDFPGLPPTRTMYLADVGGCNIRPRFLGERNAGGMVMCAPLGDGVDRIIVVEDGTPVSARESEPDFAEVADAWERITGEDIHGATTTWVGTFTDATRQVTEYRRGRVLLAGDSAHVHLPAGGQGLSTGVQDAANLGWKLAAAVAGWAPERLLDSYHSERHAVGARLLTNTRAQGQLFIGPKDLDPVRAVFAELLRYDEVRRHLVGMVSGLDIYYDMTWGRGDGGSPLLGRRLPSRELRGESGETTTARLLHSAQGVLIDLTDDPVVRKTADGWKDRVITVTAKPAKEEAAEGAADLTELAAVLVRPDGYVAWTQPRSGAESGDLASVLRQWFGKSLRE